MENIETTEPNPADEVVQSIEVRRACANIRELLPQLANLNTAFAELHELLDEHEMAGNFETACEREFGVNPDLLREATDRS